MPEPCTVPGDYDYAAAAGVYSNLAGVLAGVAFTALVLLATIASARRERPELSSATARSLLAAFLALAIASLNYSTLAGETKGLSRLADDEVFGAIAFAAGGLALLFGVALLFEGSRLRGLNHAARDLRHFSATVFPVFLLLNIGESTLDYQGVSGAEWIKYLVWAAAGVVLCWSAFVYGFRRSSEPDEWDSSLGGRLPLAALVVSIGAAVAAALSTSGPDTLCGVASSFWVALAIVAFTLLAVLSVAAQVPPRPSPES